VYGAHVANVVAELDKLDPDGQAFRYARDTHGLPTVPTLDNFAMDAAEQTMQRVATYLDAVMIKVSVDRELTEEMDRNFAP
jgi:hypothetical protein